MAIDLNGSNEYIDLGSSVPDLNGKSGCTMMSWVYINTFPSSGYDSICSYSIGGSPTDASRAAFLLDSSGNIFLASRSADSGLAELTTNTTALSLNTWYHVALIRGWGGNANDFAICVNGTILGSATTDSSAVHEIAADLLIGRGISDYFDGWMDEFRISKGVAQWTGNFIPLYGSYR